MPHIYKNLQIQFIHYYATYEFDSTSYWYIFDITEFMYEAANTVKPFYPALITAALQEFIK